MNNRVALKTILIQENLQEIRAIHSTKEYRLTFPVKLHPDSCLSLPACRPRQSSERRVLMTCFQLVVTQVTDCSFFTTQLQAPSRNLLLAPILWLPGDSPVDSVSPIAAAVR